MDIHGCKKEWRSFGKRWFHSPAGFMNSMILDLTDVSASPGDEVVLVGYPNPSIETIVGQSTPHTIPNLFSCVRTASTKMTYLAETHSVPENLT